MTLVYIELLAVVGLERFMVAEKLIQEKCKKTFLAIQVVNSV